jgi:hypothetical protein
LEFFQSHPLVKINNFFELETLPTVVFVVALIGLAIGLNEKAGQLFPPILHCKLTGVPVVKLEKVMKETSRITVVADKPGIKRIYWRKIILEMWKYMLKAEHFCTNNRLFRPNHKYKR